MRRGAGDKSLSSLMKVNYLGKAAALEAPELSQTVSVTGGLQTVSIPADADVSEVVLASGSAPNSPGESSVIPYLYHDWQVGSMTLGVNPVTLKLSYPWQTVVRVRAEGETGDKEVSIQDTSDIVWQDVGDFANGMAGKIGTFVQENRKGLILSSRSGPDCTAAAASDAPAALYERLPFQRRSCAPPGGRHRGWRRRSKPSQQRRSRKSCAGPWSMEGGRQKRG